MGGGGKGGSKSGGVNVPDMPHNMDLERLSAMSTNMWDKTNPIRGYFTEDWKQFFRPEEGKPYDPYQLPAFSPLYNMARTGLEDQYGVAKENILSNLPRGGAMGRALGNIETGRAKDVGSLQSQIAAPLISDIYNKAYNAGWVTGPTQAIGASGLATGAMNQRQMQQQQLEVAAALQNQKAEAAASSAKGSGLGSALGKGLGAVGGSVFGPLGTAIGGSLGSSVGGGLSNLGKGGGGFGGAGMTTGGLGGFSGATSFLGV